MKPGDLYNYRAIVRKVHDGDTCTVDIDLGMGVWRLNESIRLNRINAPELSSGSKGDAARLHLKSLVEGKTVRLRTVKDKTEKYGRFLGEIWLDLNRQFLNVNDLMVADGHAKPYTGS